ncbi:hypothetical protein LCGC14_1613290 [marine sediment metagenome]|uniref:Uncharacterized protein n=1 Tax=marine sediment metagenome TaxID=412755 RepID=A0A0F9IUG7_9ZZZZ
MDSSDAWPDRHHTERQAFRDRLRDTLAELPSMVLPRLVAMRQYLDTYIKGWFSLDTQSFGHATRLLLCSKPEFRNGGRKS